MKKLFLGVDIQNDFITGSLLVKSAKAKMNKLASYIKNNSKNYDVILLTADWHPANHCSFKDNGGEWPAHCIQYTSGAAIFPNVIQEVINSNVFYKILEKGAVDNIEQYSIADVNSARSYIHNIVNEYKIGQIDVCGIVGTICVKNTILGLIQMGLKEKINVLVQYTANFDDDTEFISWLEENEIKYQLN